MSPPSHIVAPLIGFATTAAAVIAMSSVVSPLLHGPEPTGRSVSAGSSTVTLSPPLRERAPLAQPGRAVSGDSAPGGLLFASAPGAASGDLAAPTAPVPAPASGEAEQAGEAGPAPGEADGLERQDTAVAGTIDVGTPPPAPLSPAASTPTTTTVELPSGAVTPEGPARRFDLRIVALDQTEDEVRIRVAIAPGPDEPATATMTIALKPTSITDAEGQAVKVSLDVVSGDAATPVLRVRVSLVEDAAGEATAVESGDNGTSNVLDISVPVTPGEPGEHPAPEEPSGSPPELLLTLDPVESSAGNASAAPTVSVAVSVTPDPDPEPAPEPPAAPTDGADDPPAPDATAEQAPPPDTAAPAPAPEAASAPAAADEPDAAADEPDAAARSPEPSPPDSAPAPDPAPAPAPDPAPQPDAAPVTEQEPAAVAPPAEPAAAAPPAEPAAPAPAAAP